MKNHLYKIVLLFCFCCVSALSAQSNKITIRGVITSASDKSGLPGAYIMLMDKDERVTGNAVTDLDGNYSIVAEPQDGDKLVITYIGMKKAINSLKGKKAINNVLTINIAMLDDNNVLETVTVTANRRISNGMMDIDERDLTTAVSTVNMEDLEDAMTSVSIDEAIQGQLAGLDMSGGAGHAGAGMSMRIRGTASVSGSSQPLIVVDGFPLETNLSEDFDFEDEEDYSQLLSIAPTDIKEISILKDAAAAVLYGSQAANGVILITTKRGTVGKPKISYTFKGTITERPKTVKTLSGDEYITLIQDGLFNGGQMFDPTLYPELANDVNQPYYFYNYGQNTDWFDAVTRTGFSQDHNVAISGGGDKAQYRISLSYNNTENTVIETSLDRITSLINIDYNISKKLTLKAGMTYAHIEDQQNYVTYLATNKDVSDMAFKRPPNMSIYEYNEVGELTGNYLTPEEILNGKLVWKNAVGNGSATYNPVAMAKDGRYTIYSNNIKPTVSLSWRPLRWLRYNFNVSLSIVSNKRKAFLPRTATGLDWIDTSSNRADDRESESVTTYTQNTLTFNPDLGNKHKLTGFIGITTNDKQTNWFKSVTNRVASPHLSDPSVPANVTEGGTVGIYSGLTQFRSINVPMSVQLSLYDRYIINPSASYDGSSRFGRDNRWGFFPSISFRWRVSGENFMRPTKSWLDDLSLRASYGINGREKRSSSSKYYDILSTYTSYDYTYLGESGTYPENLESSNLKWERSIQTNFGLNFSAFKKRLIVDAEIYKKRTEDMIYTGLTIPSTTGFSKADLNAGTMDNQGFELTVKVVAIKKKDLTLSAGFNIAHNKNYMRKISNQYPMEKGVGDKNGNYIRRFELDQSIGSIYGYRYKGVYLNQDETIARDANGNKIYTYDSNGNAVEVPMRFSGGTTTYMFQPGDAKYEDINNDGSIDEQDIVYLGNAMPLLTGGFNTNLRYKNITIGANFNFRYGNKLINYTKMNLENMNTYQNQSKAVLRRWRYSYDDPSTAPSDLLPRAIIGSTHFNYLGSDRFVEDGSFLRFSSLSFKYTFTKKQLAKLPLNTCSFTFTLNNVYLWTNYTGQDPEVTLGSDPFRLGSDRTLVPRSMRGTIGLNVSF